MSRESKLIKPTTWAAEKTIHHYESFGWELLSFSGDVITMTRETQIPVYAELVKMEMKYDQLIREYNSIPYPTAPVAPAPFDFIKCCKLLLCLIAPGAIYIGYKCKQKKAADEANLEFNRKVLEYNQKRASIEAEIEKLLVDSRAIFYGKY